MIFYTSKSAPIRSTDTIFRESWPTEAGGVLVGVILVVAPLAAAWYVHSWLPLLILVDLVTDPKARASQEQMVIELIQCGNTIAAVRLARKLYGCSLTNARRFVEELAGRSAPRRDA